MFSKAVQEHDPSVPGLKGTTLSQHYKNAANVLKPSHPSVLNSSRPPTTSNPLKRTASQAHATVSPFTSQEKAGNKRATIDRIRSQMNGGRVGKLHDDVYFDENDFDDDANIDLDADDSPVNHKHPSPAPSSATLLPDPTQKSFTNLQTPLSSTPLPWSSSPLAHHQLPPPKDPPQPAQKAAPTTNTTKRRTLPWLEESSGMVANDDHPSQSQERKGPPQSKRDAIKREKDAKCAREAAGEAYTPLPKDKPNSPYPWNKTASAVKEEQKKLRQGHKKLVKNIEEDSKTLSSKNKKEVLPKVFLSDEQRSVVDLVAEKKKSVFFTGSAGTGKSVLLRESIRVLRNKYIREPDRVAVTASTGLAACNVGGVTLHSFAGIGLGKEAVPELVRKIKRNPKAKQRWMRTKVLIVDEISMVDGDLFDKLEAIARSIRNNGRPFGGIQLVITGDFFQLPPVPDYGKIAKFAFDAATWNTSIEHTIGLTQVFRQKDPGMSLSQPA